MNKLLRHRSKRTSAVHVADGSESPSTSDSGMNDPSRKSPASVHGSSGTPPTIPEKSEFIELVNAANNASSHPDESFDNLDDRDDTLSIQSEDNHLNGGTRLKEHSHIREARRGELMSFNSKCGNR